MAARDRDARGLVVADLADHDGVGVLAKHRAQALREGKVDARVGLDLAGAHDAVLDRVLDRHDVVGAAVDLGEKRVERGRLAAADRAGREDHAVGSREEAADDGQLVGLEAEVLHVAEHGAGGHDADGDLFAKRRGDGGDAHVVLFVADGEADPAVLCVAALDDVHVGEDLEAADDGERGRRIDVENVVEEAIDAEPYDHPVLVRVEVDVGGLGVDRGLEDVVQEPRDGRLLRDVDERPVAGPEILARLRGQQPFLLILPGHGFLPRTVPFLNLSGNSGILYGRLRQVQANMPPFWQAAGGAWTSSLPSLRDVLGLRLGPLRGVLGRHGVVLPADELERARDHLAADPVPEEARRNVDA